MSYCNFSDDNVYMFRSARGGIECCSCSLTEPDHSGVHHSVVLKNVVEAIEHLHEHKAAGDAVPNYAFRRLSYEEQSITLRKGNLLLHGYYGEIEERS